MATPKAWDWTNGHVQRETGTDSLHVERCVVFTSGMHVWRLRFNIPKAIYDALDIGTLDKCRTFCQELFEKMLLVALVAGEKNAYQICLEEALRTYIENLYRGFVRLQIKSGNKKWLVPGTIQRNVLEEN
jgi:hypothetical protein